MDLLDFHFTSSIALIYAGVKCLLMALLLSASRFWNDTRLAMLLGTGLVIVSIGALFKIEHWAYADVLLVVGSVLVGGTYTWWFNTKKDRALLDYLKLAWVIAALSTAVALAVFRPSVHPLAGIAEALFWAVALLYVYQRWIRRPEHNAE